MFDAYHFARVLLLTVAFWLFACVVFFVYILQCRCVAMFCFCSDHGHFLFLHRVGRREEETGGFGGQKDDDIEDLRQILYDLTRYGKRRRHESCIDINVCL